MALNTDDKQKQDCTVILTRELLDRVSGAE